MTLIKRPPLQKPCFDYELQANASAEWLKTFIGDIHMRKRRLPQTVDPSVTRLKKLIEGRKELRMWASAMFTEVPNKIPYDGFIPGRPPKNPVQGYEHMIELFSVIVAEVAPTWTLSAAGLGLMGLPFQAVIDWPMGTPSGHAFFLDVQVNAAFKEILDVWRDKVLSTSVSRSVLTTEPGHWLCADAISAIEQDTNLDSKKRYTFEQLFDCDPRGDPVHWGFTSWDDFFVRKFRNIDTLRPVGYPGKAEWIVNPCESFPVVLKSEVQGRDQFWLKQTRYSIYEMLDNHEWAENFVGGTVYQSVLRTTAYHRWSAPVSGRVVYAAVINGTYFSERSTNGLGDEAIVGPPYNQVYLAHVATRAVIIIQADDPVGFVCFVGIGIADVSTCEILPKFTTNLPQTITKGEELGMFHYGGSCQCLVFRRGLKLAFVEEAVPGNQSRNVPIRSPLAFAYV
ncbi:hypothetical protein NLG97_g2748 [Lecanicillium saksenae]|uniref:Uncharacterized protein n=1 Tax=Lecanicillium saksenae TaxID=468837 RepID=A0ACC1R440_9HYPO|nr:hypothetical protein NLG97_g2748 [Lecanicillium saksenae]